jgi:hypothetical protein
MQVRAFGAGVATMADAADQLAALDRLALGKAGGITLKVRVIIDPAMVGRADVNGVPAATLGEEQFLDGSGRGGNDRSPFGGHDVDRVWRRAPPARA